MNDVTKTVKNLAQQAAKQAIQEPLEILKGAGKQIVGAETQDITQNENVSEEPGKSQKSSSSQEAAKLEAQGARQLQALEAELKDISKHDVFSDIQAKISNGEYVPLQDYPELSYEQREVFKAQAEAMKERKMMGEKRQTPLVEPPPKKGRQIAGMPGHVQKQQTHVERVQPPSG